MLQNTGIILQPFIPKAAKEILDMLNIESSQRYFSNLSNEFSINKNHIINNPEQLFQDMKNKIVDSHCHLDFNKF